ncbi:MAG: SdrD B-like domain-containing protein, partial [Pseudomonadota bacterium]
ADQGGDDALDSDADPITGMTQIVTLAPGENNPTLDAGIVAQLGALEGRLFCDKDGNGQDDDSMPGMDSGVGARTVILLDDMGVEIDRMETAADGTYSFTGLETGDYQVRFDVSNFTVEGVGPEATDSDADGVTGTTELVSVVGGATTSDVDAGILCFDLSEEGLLGVANGLVADFVPFLSYSGNDSTVYDYDAVAGTGRLQVTSTGTPGADQFGFSPDLARPVAISFDVELDGNGDVVDGGTNEFLVFHDVNGDGQQNGAEEIFGSGTIVAIGAQDTGTDTDQLDFLALVDGGTRQEEFSDFFAGQLSVESQPGESFAGSFEDDFEGLAKGFASALAFDCIC